MSVYGNNVNERALFDILSKKFNEEVLVQTEFRVAEFSHVFSLHFSDSNITIHIPDYEIGVEIKEDYSFNNLLDGIMKYLQENHSMLFI